MSIDLTRELPNHEWFCAFVVSDPQPISNERMKRIDAGEEEFISSVPLFSLKEAIQLSKEWEKLYGRKFGIGGHKTVGCYFRDEYKTVGDMPRGHRRWMMQIIEAVDKGITEQQLEDKWNSAFKRNIEGAAS